MQKIGWKEIKEGRHLTLFAKPGPQNLHARLVDTCILSGSDYLCSLYGIGLTTPVDVMVTHGDCQTVSITSELYINAINFITKLRCGS